MEKKKYLYSVNKIKKDIVEKTSKHEAKELQKIADEKINYKISKVEEIDSLIMSSKK